MPKETGLLPCLIVRSLSKIDFFLLSFSILKRHSWRASVALLPESECKGTDFSETDKSLGGKSYRKVRFYCIFNFIVQSISLLENIPFAFIVQNMTFSHFLRHTVFCYWGGFFLHYLLLYIGVPLTCALPVPYVPLMFVRETKGHIRRSYGSARRLIPHRQSNMKVCNIKKGHLIILKEGIF